MKTPEFTLEDFEIAMLYVSTRPNTVPKKIKVTHNFYNYLAAKFTEDVIHEKDNSPRDITHTSPASPSRSTTPLKTNTTNLYIKGETL